MNYKQLVEGQRYQIFSLMYEGLSFRQIAKRLNVSHTTVNREVKRNARHKAKYCPEQAHGKALTRRYNAAKYRIDDMTRLFVELCLSLKWSPEQIAGIAKRIGYSVSHEWIYRYVMLDKRCGGKLFKHLRRRHKRYKKGLHGKRELIPNLTGIEDRPLIVDTKNRFGDWEIDTVLGKQGTGAIVSIVERKTKLYLLGKVNSKRAEDVTAATVSMLWKIRSYVKKITADHGSEFVGHEEIARKLNADAYFADPYASHQRGLNENFNGLLRQYIPKGTDLRTISHRDIEKIQKSINMRPRKCLDFQQPAVVFEEQMAA